MHIYTAYPLSESFFDWKTSLANTSISSNRIAHYIKIKKIFLKQKAEQIAWAIFLCTNAILIFVIGGEQWLKNQEKEEIISGSFLVMNLGRWTPRGNMYEITLGFKELREYVLFDKLDKEK